MKRYFVIWALSLLTYALSDSVAIGLVVALLLADVCPNEGSRWSWEGKRVVVTGGAGGLGYAVAKELLRRGGRPVLWDVDERGLERAAGELGEKVAVKRVDVTDRAAVGAAAAEFAAAKKSVDAVVCASGVAGGRRCCRLSDEEMLRVLDVNLNGPVWTLQALAPLLRQSGGRAAVVSSAAASVGSIAGITPYCASKWGLTGVLDAFYRSQQEGLEGPLNKVPVTTISPSFMTTAMFEGVSLTPLQQLLTPAVTPEHVAGEALDAVAACSRRAFLPRVFWVVRLAAALLPGSVIDLLSSTLGVHDAAEGLREKRS
ncbi:3-oxoacyl-[acyl-carrier-protein] reductase FabG [Diplonema papillatum]|nr:3-oxoacyl-[acyl-carrier-protein] reductase FabG [Diplonema papillatum]